MGAKRKDFFFDSNYMDRFNNGDIPTEQVLRDLIDSIPFIKEVNDRSQLTKAGISKTTTDNKVNNRDGSDKAGESPLNFPTFVKANQLFDIKNFLNDTSLTISKVRRDSNDTGETDSGNGIKDFFIKVNFPAPPDIPENDQDISHTISTPVNSLLVNSNEVPSELSVIGVSSSSNPGDTLSILLQNIVDGINSLASTVQTNVDFIKETRMEPGDFCYSIVSPFDTAVPPVSNWSDHYIDASVSYSLNVNDYPELYNKIGFTFGGSGSIFVTPVIELPDSYQGLTDQYYVKLKIK